jgi:hypothetical protein
MFGCCCSFWKIGLFLIFQGVNLNCIGDISNAVPHNYCITSFVLLSSVELLVLSTVKDEKTVITYSD